MCLEGRNGVYKVEGQESDSRFQAEALAAAQDSPPLDRRPASLQCRLPRKVGHAGSNRSRPARVFFKQTIGKNCEHDVSVARQI